MKKRRTRTSSRSAPFSLLVKPAGPDCNLRCTYCFYLKKAAVFSDRTTHRMNSETLDRLVASYMQTKQPVYSFGWQGGEPTLMGVDFFRDVTRLQEKYGKPGVQVANGLQTNSTLITDELAEHLGAYHFLVGASIDGPAELHDVHRRTRGDKPTHATVIDSVERLRRHRVEVNALTLVSQANVGEPERVYRFLKENGLNYMQFIPCVEFTPSGELAPFAVSGREWGEFLLKIFELWHKNDVRDVSIRHHDALMSFLLDGSRHMCTMGGSCDAYFVVEHNGEVYPCDFYVEPELKLGNVLTDTWESMAGRPTRVKFARQKSDWHDACNGCAHLPYCSGDCIKHRDVAPDGRGSWLCEGWDMFYERTVPVFRDLARQVAAERGFHGPLWEPNAYDPERPCYCGSGRKAKNCHLSEVNQSTTA